MKNHRSGVDPVIVLRRSRHNLHMLLPLLALIACLGPSEKGDSSPYNCVDAGDHPLLTWYPDADGDGYGDISQPTLSCQPDPTWVLAGPDCDTNDPAVNPAAEEVCNGKDDNCDTRIDEPFDKDQDGYLSVSIGCNGTDCNDNDPLIHPDMYDACEDGLDWDCDGIDPACGASRPVGEADVSLTSPYENYEAGRLLYTGDTNGDGNDDVLISTLAANTVAGGAILVTGPVLSDNSLGTVGIELPSTETGGGAGRSIVLADLNGDGMDDVGVGIPFGANCSESVLFGPIAAGDSLSAPDLSFRNSAEGFCGHGSDFLDVNGDGFADAVIGAYAESSGAFEAGSVYVKYGPLVGGVVDLAGEKDAKLVGEGASFWTGRVVRGAPDLNGDGIGDILMAAVGATLGGPNAGAVYVVAGPPPEILALGDAYGRLVGEAPYDYAGISIASADLTGDGLSDVVVGAQSSANASSCGGTYVIPGPAAGDLALADAVTIIRGEEAGQLAGAGLGVGDLDGNGRSDLLVGAPGDTHGGTDAGATYIFLLLQSGTLSVSNANLRIEGSAEIQAGWGLASGDLDGDGLQEAVVGAPHETTGGSAAGAIYLFSL